MKKLLLISGVLLAFTASLASANGQIHLAVGDCGGPSTLSNPCNQNSGSFVLLGSFVSDFASNQVIGVESIVDVAQASTLSAWWRTDAAGCRAGRISSDFSLGSSACFDLFAGAASGGQGVSYPGTASTLIPANSERFDIFCAVDAATPLTIDTSTENAIFHFNISRIGTLGPTACGGCAVPTNICLNDVLVAQEPGHGDVHESGDGNGQCVSYNGGNTPTPTKSSSWGSIKTLYR